MNKYLNRSSKYEGWCNMLVMKLKLINIRKKYLNVFYCMLR